MKEYQITVIGIALSVSILTGCSLSEDTSKLYSNQRVEALYESTTEDYDRADSFARDLCVISKADSNSQMPIIAEAAGVFGIDNQSVLYRKNVFERLYPASITKVMTALVVIKYGNLEDSVTVGDETIITEAGATLCNIKPGDTLTMKQLLYGLMLPSGNDAGAAIAVHMAGSIEGFNQLMNKEANALGATDTHFLNPHGLHDEQHYTTAYDLYLILKEALQYDDFRTVIGTTSYTADFVDAGNVPRSETWKNSNKYLTGEQNTPAGLTVLGGKTGTTKAAGYCLMIACEDAEGMEYISVVLKSDSRPNLYDNMTNIIQKIVN